MPTLSERDLELIHALQIAPRVSWTDAGEILHAHPTALAERWGELRRAGMTWQTAHYTGRARQQVLAFAEVRCPPQQLAATAQQLSRIPEVLSIDVQASRYGLVLTVFADSVNQLSTIACRVSEQSTVTQLELQIVTRMHFTASDWTLRALNRRQVQALRDLDAAQRELDPAITLTTAHAPVIAALQRNARCSAADIARATGMSDATARRRLARVLHSNSISLRTEMSQDHSGLPVTAAWQGRLPAEEHEEVARRLAASPMTRLVTSRSADTNYLVSMWLPAVSEALPAERALRRSAPNFELVSSTLLLPSVKRLGWLLRPDSTTTGEFIAPPSYLG